MSEGNGNRIEGYKVQLTENEMRELETLNATLLGRESLIKKLLDPRRDMDDECGFPDPITMDDYRKMYEREGCAARVVELMPKECWQVQPLVYESEDPDDVTDFEEAWDALGRSLRGQKSWYKREEGSPIWDLLSRADEVSGIGSFGVILLGFDDGGELTDAVKPGSAKKLLYARALPEYLVSVATVEQDRQNVRYGQPTSYNVTLSDWTQSDGPAGQSLAAVTTGTLSQTRVHWTRILHVADVYHTASSSDLYAVPRMRPVFNHLMGLQKLYAGSPEMYWRGAFPGISLETNPQLGGDVRVNKSAVRDQMEQYMNGLQRFLMLSGLTAKTMSPTVVDPTGQVNVQIEAICLKLGVPKRIFVGSERGELASGQDDSTWNDRLRARQNNYLTPRLIVPFVDRMIWAGVLPEPGDDGYVVKWPDLDTPKATVRAQVGLTVTQALSAYVTGGVENLVPPLDFLTRVLGIPDDEARQILESSQRHLEDLNPDASADELIPGHGLVDLEPESPEEGMLPEGEVEFPPEEAMIEEE